MAQLTSLRCHRRGLQARTIKEDCHADGWTFTEFAQEQPDFASGDFLFWAFLIYKGLLGA